MREAPHRAMWRSSQDGYSEVILQIRLLRVVVKRACASLAPEGLRQKGWPREMGEGRRAVPLSPFSARWTVAPRATRPLVRPVLTSCPHANYSTRRESLHTSGLHLRPLTVRQQPSVQRVLE